jgi:NTP pyrophosphatase (non-canonical NTP hydrolase)
LTDTEDKLAQQHLSRIAEVFLTEDDQEVIMPLMAGLLGNNSLRKKMARVVRDYCAQNLRPEILKFAGLMEMKLLKHDSARGQRWKSGDAEHHIARIKAITEELDRAVDEGKRIGVKAADLANHAMMLADQAGELEDV